MLKNMEPEMEIFRAWLQKYVNEDKKITGVSLADKLKKKELKSSKATVSAYVSGRLIYGERKFTKIPFEIRQAISEIVNIPYKQILKEGSEILSLKPASDIEKRLQKLESQYSSTIQSQGKPLDMVTELHRNLIDKFRQKKLAYELNELLLEIERINPESLKSALETLELIKIKAEQEAAKKRTVNGND